MNPTPNAIILGKVNAIFGKSATSFKLLKTREFDVGKFKKKKPDYSRSSWSPRRFCLRHASTCQDAMNILLGKSNSQSLEFYKWSNNLKMVEIPAPNNLTAKWCTKVWGEWKAEQASWQVHPSPLIKIHQTRSAEKFIPIKQLKWKWLINSFIAF